MGRGNSSVFLRDRRKHLWGGIGKGQGHCQTVLVGSGSQHAQPGRVGTKLRVPGQHEDLGSIQEPLLGKIPGNRGQSNMLETCLWNNMQQRKRMGDSSAQ